MKLFGIEDAPGGVLLHLPSGRHVTVALAHDYAGAQALGRHVLAAFRSPSEPQAAVKADGTTAPGGGRWTQAAAEHLRTAALEVLRPSRDESLEAYLERLQVSTPTVLFRTLQRIVGT
ncbi:MAG: hypothetical protein ACE37F_00790 [Nannocystaceae bacterium]|nr:hypothetical protein [bacterium]